jgi:hypothetical protein
MYIKKRYDACMYLTLASAFKYTKQKSTRALRLDSLRLMPSISFAERNAAGETKLRDMFL